MATAESKDIRLPTRASEGELPAGADPFTPENQTLNATTATAAALPETGSSPGFEADLLITALLVLLVLLAVAAIRILRLRESVRMGRDEVAARVDEARQLRRLLSDFKEKSEARIRRRTGLLLERNQQSGRERDELVRTNRLLRGMIRCDPLTGLANGPYFQRRLEAELRRSLRGRRPVSLILCDVDFFRRYNRAHGHDKGDELLKRIGALMAGHFRRGGDVTARLDADRFAALAPDMEYDAAVLHVSKLHRQMRELGASEEESNSAEKVTVSMGIICIHPSGLQRPHQVLERAIRTLKLAKERGRDRVAGDPGRRRGPQDPQSEGSAPTARRSLGPAESGQHRPAEPDSGSEPLDAAHAPNRPAAGRS